MSPVKQKGQVSVTNGTFQYHKDIGWDNEMLKETII